MILTPAQKKALTAMMPTITTEIKVLFLKSLPADLTIEERCSRIQALNVACLTINRCNIDELAYYIE
ncbi:MAG TPA: hypothetical protein EYN54_12075 [Methylococcaceae bacterium]|nr:hypothetical protein [Methylococcaceae bacterium]